MKKKSTILFIIALFALLIANGQQQEITINSALSGYQVHEARDAIYLKPGFSYTGLSGLFNARINPRIICPAIYQTPVDISTREINTNLAVGAIKGIENVAPNGAFTYSIPIKVSPGTAGMQPAISVEYNSQMANGLLGIGWNLSGISSISRVSQNLFVNGQIQDVKLDETDRFALDGNQLIVTNGGIYGANGTEYHTQQESFVKVTSYSGTGSYPNWFQVETKDGITREYGRAYSSYVLSNSRSVGMNWYLSKVYDKNGNYITYTYHNDRDKGEFWLEKIEYTGTNGFSPYNSVNFYYDSRNDINTTYVAGSKSIQNVVLRKISITNESKTVRSYEFKYNKDLYSHLNEIVEYGSDGTSLNSTVINWKKGESVKSSYVDVNLGGGSYYPGDFNGDGRTDMVVSSGNVFKLYLANQNGLLEYKTENAIEDVENEGYVELNVIDFDNDGVDDIFLRKHRVNMVTICQPCEFSNVNQSNLANNLNSTVTSSLSSNPDECCYDEEYHFEIFYKYKFDGNVFQSLGEVNQGSQISGTDLFSKDFDGDGIQELLFLNKTAKNIVWISNLQLNSLPTFNNPVDVQFIDFNGNGKTDILVIENYNRKIYEYDLASKIFKELLSTNTTYREDVLTGDFNGDGKTDLFSLSENRIFHSTGISYVVASGFPKFGVLFVGDFNGDGKDDILQKQINPENENEEYIIHYSNGNTFVEENDVITMFFDPRAKFNLGDFNGDGKKDLAYSLFPSDPTTLIFFHKNEQELLVHDIEDGIGSTVSISYLPLSQTSFYNRSNINTTDLRGFQGSKHVVTFIAKPNGIGGYSSMNFEYTGGVSHLKGYGFLGFSKVTRTNNELSVKVVNEYEFNNTWFVPVQAKSTTYMGNTKISESNYVNQFVDFGNKRYFSYISQETSTDFLHENSSSTSSYQFDNFGNLQTKNTKVGGVLSTLTTHHYTSVGAWCPNRIDTTIIKTNRQNEAAFISKSCFQYFGNGLLKQAIEEVGNPKQVYTNYTYNEYGNVTEIKVSPDGVNGRVTSFSYDIKQRLVTRRSNVLGHYIEMDYDYGTGNVIETRDHNALKTTSQYDAFGRLAQVTGPDGSVTTTSHKWVTNNGPQYASYYSETAMPGIPAVREYFDIMGRNIRQDKASLDGRRILIDTRYNAKGQVDYVTLPYFEGESDADRMVYRFDSFGRIESETGPGVNISYSYNGLVTTTSNLITGISTSSTMDVTGVVVKNSDGGGDINYTHNSAGLIRQIQTGGSLTKMEYDQFGNQTKLEDPNAGTYSYQYNVYGELDTQTDPLGRTTRNLYDNIGRMYSQTGGSFDVTTTFKPNGLVEKVTATNGVVYEYGYNGLNQLTSKTECINGKKFITGYLYDSSGRLKQLTYPSGFKIDYLYQNGYLKEIRRNDNQKIIWSLTSVNAKGQVKATAFGNGLTSSRNYYANGLISSIVTGTSNSVQNLEYHFNSRNLMDWRKDNRRNLTESFDYDELNRLNSIQLGSSQVKDVVYLNNGNIDYKYDVGNYTYGGPQPNAVTQVSNPEQLIPQAQQNITYTTFNKIASITEGGNNASFVYGPDHSRKLVTSNIAGVNTSKYYSDGCEYEDVDGEVRELHYIVANNEIVAIFEKKNDGVEAMHYVHTDHLGSLNVITNESGAIEQELSFDAWGNRRDKDTWQNLNVQPTGLITDRGFTGHEHMDGFKLINMNGRFYDPMLGRFLSPDPFVQASGFTQSYNRYSYCVNNPLSFTDPSGYTSMSFWESVERLYNSEYGGTLSSSGETYFTSYSQGLNAGIEYNDLNGSWGYTEYGSESATRAVYNYIKSTDPYRLTLGTFSGNTRNHWFQYNPYTSTFYIPYTQTAVNPIKYMNLIDPTPKKKNGWKTDVDDIIGVAGLELTGVGFALKDFAKSKVKYKYGNRLMTAAEKTATEKAAAFKAAKFSKTLGRGVGAVGVIITAMEGFSDGDMSAGDWTKMCIGVITTATPIGWAYGIIDLGYLVVTNESLTDKIGATVDNW